MASPIGHPARDRVCVLITLVVVVLSLLTGCSAPAERGERFPDIDLSEQSYRVGGKNFNEQLVLCQITIAMLETAGASVSDHCDVGSTEQTRQALVTGQIDMYWEYTGTGWTNHLHQTMPSNDSDTLYRAVADGDRRNGITWLAPTPMNDTYTFAVDTETASRMNIQTFSDMGRVLSAGGGKATVCMENEFFTRPEGWVPMQRTYGFTAPDNRVSVLDVNAIYPLIGSGKQCTFGEVYSTDGRINQLGLTVLADDKSLLPKYNASLTVRTEIFNKDARIAQLMQPVTDALNDRTMLDLNTRVANGEKPETVARDWLRDQDFIG